MSLLLVLSIPPCSTCLKKLALLVNIIPSWALEPIKTSLKILVGTPIAIATLAVVYMYTLLRQKKYQVALGAIIAIRALASLYLKASQVTIDEHNAQLKNAIELASKATPREFFKLLMDIQAVEESNGRPISSEAISILLNKYITSLPREISREEFAGKMHDVLSYLSTSLTQTNNATPQFLQSLCILHTQSHTQNPFLTLSLLETTESLLENTESLLAKTKDISTFYVRITQQKYIMKNINSIFDLANLQLEAWELKIASIETLLKNQLKREKVQFDSIAKIIVEYVSPEFIDVLFIRDVLFVYPKIPAHPIDLMKPRLPFKAEIMKKVEKIQQISMGGNYAQQRLEIILQIKPLDFSQKTLSARLEPLNETVFNP